MKKRIVILMTVLSMVFGSAYVVHLLIKDAGKFMDEYFLKRNVPAFQRSKKEAYNMLKNAAECACRATKAAEYIRELAVNKYSVVPLARMGIPSDGSGFEEKFGQAAPFFYSPIDSLFDNYRGMMGVFEDLIEKPEKLEKACDAIAEYNSVHTPKMTAKEKEAPLPMGYTVYHVAPYLSSEQYDKF